ncbi:MAG: hypothetical protein RRA94_09435 [Bacteroidota bacterium]|nr:hypothetical protein [Bacteroidota bacterium]
MNRFVIIPTLVLGTLLLMPGLAEACPNCKEAYMGDGGQSPVASGFNTSIIFMMIMPFLVIGGFVLRLWLAQRRRQSVDTTAEAMHYNG